MTHVAQSLLLAFTPVILGGTQKTLVGVEGPTGICPVQDMCIYLPIYLSTIIIPKTI